MGPEFPTLAVTELEETQAESVETKSVKSMSYKTLRDVIADTDEPILIAWLTEERKSETPRASVVKLITAALNALKESA